MFLHNCKGANTDQSKAMCTASIANLRLLVECEKDGKESANGCIAQHKELFSGLFSKHTDDNKNALNSAVEMKNRHAEQLDILQTSLDQKFKAFEADYKELLNLVSKKNIRLPSIFNNANAKLFTSNLII